MAYSGLSDFIRYLEENDELQRIKIFVDPVLEIAEVTDRVTKSGGKALLFENTGTNFPVLINAFGSDKRMSIAIGRDDPGEAGQDIERAFTKMSASSGNLIKKLSHLPDLIKLSGILPVKSSKKGKCQQVVHNDPDLEMLPVLKCWPFDGGRFITLPIVHTFHPETGSTNAGMYRMQILDKCTTAMHWQLHKTGANHFEAWKKTGKKMPVSVALGGDPVYTYSATAPLPENIDEYILAGFLRRKRVRLVKCITNNLYIPEDADIIIEGYVDPAEDPVWEGPFGDHTGFYSLADWYPKFHVTCITHSKNAIYPATIVGIPPQEDSFLAKATENIFLAPVKITLQPEIEDLHMPDAGVAHNLVVVKIKKSYPGQGMKVINSLFGAGQMMFTKHLVVVSGDVDIRNYMNLLQNIFINTDFGKDLIFCSGPLDVLDHSSDTFSFGGKLGIDATIKTPEEISRHTGMSQETFSELTSVINDLRNEKLIKAFNISLLSENIPVLFISVNRTEDSDIINKVAHALKSQHIGDHFKLVLAVDHTVDIDDFFTLAWQMLGNSDPVRDHYYISESSLIIDGTIKAFRTGGFIRRWPNIVVSDNETINAVDQKWELMSIGPFIPSPSLKSGKLKRSGDEEINIR
jgi:4-hydroxy-3-polyprenylbenzoate decarboxylase